MDSKKLPTVTVIIPVYNREELLRQTLESVRSQSYVNWECIVVDDGSIDQSLGVAQEFGRLDSRFHAISRRSSKNGASVCRNEGLKAARGKYSIFLDSDDLLHPDCLFGRLEFMSQCSAELDFGVFPTLVFRNAPGDSDLLWNIDKPESDLYRFLRLDVAWSTTGAIWKTESVKKIGGFDESLPGWQDWQLHVVAILEGLKYFRCPAKPDSFWREHISLQIGDQADQIDHIKAKTVFLLGLLGKYSDQLLFTNQLKAAATGLVWFQVRQMLIQGANRDALRTWNDIKRLDYISLKVWAEGLLAILMHGKVGGGVIWRKISSWPESVLLDIDRSTCSQVSCTYSQLYA